MKYVHCSDLHLDHAKSESLKSFFEWTNKNVDSDTTLLVTGDITSSRFLQEHLCALSDNCSGKVLFVLGNHDYWDSCIAQVERDVRKTVSLRKNIVFMDDVDKQVLEDGVVIVGDSGWYDCRLGRTGRFVMNDWSLITDFRRPFRSKEALSTSLADARVDKLKNKISKAISSGAKKIVVLTHVPPFAEVALYKGQPSSEWSLPVFTCKILGESLLDISQKHEDVNVEVLCGHTHDAASLCFADNLRVTVASANYGYPSAQFWSPKLFA